MAGGPHDFGVPHDHVVNFYDDDDDVVAELINFVADGLRLDAGVIVVATQAHRDALDAGLAGRGIDPDQARETGRYQCADAAGTLARFMVGSVPDGDRFRAVVGAFIARAGDRPVRVFGEMVALLWEGGNVTGAIELESLWNGLGEDHAFSLYCAYPGSVLDAATDLGVIEVLCERHSAVLPPLSYSATAPDTGPLAGLVERSKVFVPVTTAVRAARRFVIETLSAWGEDGLLADAALVVSELASNAVRHAGSPFRASVLRSDSVVRITVEDASGLPPRRSDPSSDRLGGRGVALVASLSTRWGSELVADGKVVWSELTRSRARLATT